MLKSWLGRVARGPQTHKFLVEDIDEKFEPDESITRYIAHTLLIAHGNPEMLRREVQILSSDASDLRLNIVKKYVEEQIIPDKDKIQARIGNFGEALAANFLVETEDFSFPIYKLRFREKRNWAMRLTDLFLVRMSEEQIPLICYGEVKTKSSGCDLQLAVKGHESIAKDDALENPEILRFICTWLYETEMYEEGEFFSKIRLGKLAYDRRHDLFLIHDTETWREQILDNLDDIELDNRLVSFSIKVIRIANLRTVIDAAYSCCGLVAEEILDA